MMAATGVLWQLCAAQEHAKLCHSFGGARHLNIPSRLVRLT